MLLTHFRHRVENRRGSRPRTARTFPCLLLVTLALLLLGSRPSAALVRAPVLLDYEIEDAPADSLPVPLRNGDTVVLRTRWTVPDSVELADRLIVTADFSRLEQPAGSTYVDRVGGGVYRIIHQIPLANTRSDSAGLVIPVRAEGPDSTTTDRRIRLCLSNHSPIHSFTEIVDRKLTPYRMGDSLFIRTAWLSQSGCSLSVTADITNIEADTTATGHRAPRVLSQSGNTFLIGYRIPLNAGELQPEGPGKIVPVTAYERGCCGRTTVRVVSIDLDTQPPPADQLHLDPLPEVTTLDSVVVSGSAQDAALVLILRDQFALVSVVPDSASGRFRGVIPLLPGLNEIQVRAEDIAGNSTPLVPTNALIVARVDRADLAVGFPFSRRDRVGRIDDDISLRDPIGMSLITIRIFNLEGDCVYEETSPGPRQHLSFHWNGDNRSGERAPQGYYLVRAEWHDGEGQARNMTRGLLLRD